MARCVPRILSLPTAAGLLFEVVVCQKQDDQLSVHDRPRVFEEQQDILPANDILPAPGIVARRDRDEFGG